MTTVTETGFCPSCRRNVLDHPALTCPWCSAVSTALARRDLVIAEDASPAEVLRATTDHLRALEVRMASAKHLRTEAARRALAGDVVAIAARAGVRVRSVERWAEGRRPPACAKGHVRAEHGRWDGKRRQWVCTACEGAREPRKAPARRRPRSGRVKDLWRAHERRMAQRRALADAGELPERLSAPLAPPVGGPPGQPTT